MKLKKMTNKQKLDLALMWIDRALFDKDAAKYELTEALEKIRNKVDTASTVLNVLKLVS